MVRKRLNVLGVHDRAFGRMHHLLAALAGLVALAFASLAFLAAPAYAATTTLAFTPTSGVAGAPISFTGSGWTAYGRVQVSMTKGTVVTPICAEQADGNGALVPLDCAIPTTVVAGAYTISATDSASKTATATGTLAVTPSLTLTSTASSATIADVAVGQVVNVSGAGFAATSPLTATFGGTAISLSPASPKSSATGGLSGETFTVPSVTPGTVVFSVKDTAADTATYSLTVVKPTITHSPSTGLAYKPVSVSGAGWLENDSVTLSLVSGASSTSMCTVTADSTGAIDPTSCVVPYYIPAGSYQMVASDGSVVITDPTTFVLAPSVSLLGPDSAATTRATAGQTVGVLGYGFAATSGVTATFAGTAVALSPAVTTQANGGFATTSFVVPASTPVSTAAVVFKDAAGHTANFNLSVYKPTISAAVSTGASGHPIRFAGTGWPGNDSVTVSLSSLGVSTTVCTLPSDSTGTIVSTSCKVPTTVPYGKYTITGTDNLNLTNSMTVSNATQFTVTPGITITGANGTKTPSAAVGQTVGIYGTGYAANATSMSATFAGSALTLTPSPTTNSQGATPSAAPPVTPAWSTFKVPTVTTPATTR